MVLKANWYRVQEGPHLETSRSAVLPFLITNRGPGISKPASCKATPVQVRISPDTAPFRSAMEFQLTGTLSRRLVRLAHKLVAYLADVVAHLECLDNQRALIGIYHPSVSRSNRYVSSTRSATCVRSLSGVEKFK